MRFKKTTSDQWHKYSMISNCGNYKLAIMPTIFGNRIRIYEAPDFNTSDIDWCVGKDKPLAERLMGLILHYLKNRSDLGELPRYPISNVKPIHNDPVFLNKLLGLATGRFRPHKLRISL